MHSVPALSRRRSVIVALAALLAAALCLVGMIAAPSASAKEIQPTASDVKLTDHEGNPVTQVTNQRPYRISFTFSAPSGTAPGDTFTVTLPEGFTASAGKIDLSGLATATATGSDNKVLVTFTDRVQGMTDIRGGFTFLADYTARHDVKTDVSGDVLLGTPRCIFPSATLLSPPAPATW